MSFTWDGVNCETLGMYVERYPSRQFAQRKATVYDVPGRSGALVVDEDAYTNVSQEYEVFVKGGTVGLQSRLDVIASWLLTKEGYADLTDTYDTTVTRKARVANAIEFLNALNKFGKATIVFDCWPQRYPNPAEELSMTNTIPVLTTITYPSGAGMLPALPLITVREKSANTTILLHIKDLTVEFTDSAESWAYADRVMIDFSTRSIYKKQSLTSPTYALSGNWSKLGDGDTVDMQVTVTGSPVSSMTNKVTVETRRFKL